MCLVVKNKTKKSSLPAEKCITRLDSAIPAVYHDCFKKSKSMISKNRKPHPRLLEGSKIYVFGFKRRITLRVAERVLFTPSDWARKKYRLAPPIRGRASQIVKVLNKQLPKEHAYQFALICIEKRKAKLQEDEE